MRCVSWLPRLASARAPPLSSQFYSLRSTQCSTAARSRPRSVMAPAFLRHPVAFIAIFVCVVSSILAVVFPHLRKAIGLILLGLCLAYVRQRFFAVPGVSAIPFGHTSKLFQGRGGAGRRHKRD